YEMFEKIRRKLRESLAHELHVQVEDVDEDMRFTDMGVDSIIGVTWIRKINTHYGLNITITKIYDYSSIMEFARFLQKELAMHGKGSMEKSSQQPSSDTLKQQHLGKVVISHTDQHMTDCKDSLLERLLEQKNNAEAHISSVKITPSFGIETTQSILNATEEIAIIGMAGQFPQANDLNRFWENLAQGKDCISEVLATRWSVDQHYDPDPEKPGKTYCKWLGALDDVDQFDPLFFNISPAEAESMDPQQRLFLQSCWECIEEAGLNPIALSESRCGVFVGCGPSDYGQWRNGDHGNLSAQGLIGNSTSILSARIAYLLNLKGPCMAIDTACSSSLVAISEACNSLLLQTSDLSLAGGVCVLSGPSMHIMTSKAGMLSTDGCCFTFDQRANGFVPGEGVGVILLKRLSDAQRDGDQIHGVIKGWGVNQD
ncbi:MAG: type I polyketide synthase, partial [Planctomycetes bacterium]|nr:type I polyketide synthase [Planctomycetota bacterium]